jgi:uncharacterized coiled-coil protein SlyX
MNNGRANFVKFPRTSKQSMTFPDTIEGCHTLITELLAIIAELRIELAELRTQNAEFQTRMNDLEHQLNQNSRNSHRPPSSDGLTKPGIPKPPSGKKQGGQFGHRGNTLTMVETPDERVELRPEVCEHCQKKFTGREHYHLKSRRQVFDLPPMALQVKEYASYGCRCTRCGKENQGAYPRGVTAPVQYGSGVRSLVVVKVAGCFRTILGAAQYARINSFFSTVRKQRFNPFTELLKVFNGSIPDYRLGST